MIRNWKYEFQVTSVSGGGYRTPRNAAFGVPADINVKIIPWDKSGVIGVGNGGDYYAEMPDKEVVLPRTGDGQIIPLYYTTNDSAFDINDINEFSMVFADDPDGKPDSAIAMYNGFTVAPTIMVDDDGNEDDGHETGTINLMVSANSQTPISPTASRH